MICSNCGNDFDGNFCPICGQPAPQEVYCPSCGTLFKGNFCPTCGEEYIEPIDYRCRNLYDVDGNLINVDLLAGVYLSVSELRGYFMRNTDYSSEEIEEYSNYIYEYIDGDDVGILESISVKSQFEAPGKRIRAEQRVEAKPRNRQYQAQPLTKLERIRENKRNGVACCPKCGSTSLSANKKGFGIGKAVLGASIAGNLGLMAGNINAKKVWVTCLNCGHRWKL